MMHETRIFACFRAILRVHASYPLASHKRLACTHFAPSLLNIDLLLPPKVLMAVGHVAKPRSRVDKRLSKTLYGDEKFTIQEALIQERNKGYRYREYRG
jgi:hypothetical protein